nr:MAG TPA: hypothetical protein [Caudoviricetes sp.]
MSAPTVYVAGRAPPPLRSAQSFIESAGYGKKRERLARLCTSVARLRGRVTHFFARPGRTP